jgi:hypothetical protein
VARNLGVARLGAFEADESRGTLVGAIRALERSLELDADQPEIARVLARAKSRLANLDE